MTEVDTLPDGVSRLADGAMIVIMMLVPTILMDNGGIRDIALRIFGNAQAMLCALLFHFVLVHQWQKPGEDIA